MRSNKREGFRGKGQVRGSYSRYKVVEVNIKIMREKRVKGKKTLRQKCRRNFEV